MRTDTHGMTGRGRIVLGAFLAVGAGLLLLACDNNSDPVAPADSTITVSANPQTVVVPSGGGQGAAEIVATLRSANGTRLPDQEITFSTTAGFLDPPAETPIKTDGNGQATCILTTTSSATVTARSGSISGMTQIQTASGNISTLLLDVSPTELLTCSDQISVQVTVLDNNGGPVAGVVIRFTNPNSTVSGNFAPTQAVSDSSGIASSVWTPSTVDCPLQCQFSTGDPNSPTRGTCTLFIGAEDVTGSFQAVPEQIDDNIP